jgi:LysM repeat protein
MKFLKIMRRAGLAIAAVAILTANMSWAGIVNNLPTIRVNGKVMYYYDTQSGDNIYTVADKLGVSVDDIRETNPSVADGIKPRMRLFFPTDIATTESGSSSMPLTHVVAKGESIYGIARQYGMTMDELLALNPAAADGIKVGMRLNLKESSADIAAATPAETVATTAAEPTAVAKANAAKAEATPAAAPEVTPATIAATEPEAAPEAEPEAVTVSNPDSLLYAPAEEAVAEQREMHIAIILPFLLNEKTMGRQTKLYTEFYKGFLLAADTLNLPGRTPVRIHTYDSSASLDSITAIMNRPEIANMDMIVTSDNPTFLKTVAHKAASNTLILNLFAVKDSSYTSLPNMIQTNIPHDEMYEQAINGFLDNFPFATPVFLTRNGGKNDKEEFTSALKAKLTAEGRFYQTVNFDGYLSDADLEGLTPDVISYVLIPNSGNRDEFTRIQHAIKSLKNSAVDGSTVQLFGYPEWATFRGTQFDDICELETTIYSRYVPTNNDYDASSLNTRFRQVYGEGLIDKQMPVFGILGFDTGRMAIEGMRTMAGTGSFPSRYVGIQSGLKLERAANGGLFNNALFFITYKPGGIVDKTLR